MTITQIVRMLDRVEPSLREVLLAILDEIEHQREKQVTKEEFNELKEIVRELAEAQRRTEQMVEELAKAQKKTEQRVEELAQAQNKSEQKLTRLERVIEELAEAQKRTEQELKELASALKETRRQMGDLTDTVGYTLENAAYKALPGLLKRDYGLQIKGPLKRGYLKDRRGHYIEVNILGEGRLNGKKVTIIGESKTRLSKKGVQEFIQKRLRRLEDLYGEIFPVMITHMISEPDVEEYVRQKGIVLYYSYEF